MPDAVHVSQVHDMVGRLGKPNSDITRRGLRRDERRCLADCMSRGTHVTRNLETARIALRHIEKIVRDAGKVLTGALDATKVVFLLRGNRARKFHREEFDVPHDRLERVSQLVRRERHESLAHHDRSLSDELRGLRTVARIAGDHSQPFDLRLPLRQFL